MPLHRLTIAAILLICTGPATAQPTPVAAPTGWDRLSGLDRGTRVRLQLVDGSEIRGRLVNVADDAVVIERSEIRRGPYAAPAGASPAGPLTFRRSDIAAVQKAGGWPWWGTVAIIGVAVYVAIGTILVNSSA